MIELSSIVPSSPLVPALNSAPPGSFGTLFESAASAVHADIGPELAKNPASVNRLNPSSHIENDVSPESLIITSATDQPSSPAEPIKTKIAFRDHGWFESAEAKPASHQENLQVISPAIVTEKPVDQNSPQALPLVALPLQQSLDQKKPSDASPIDVSRAQSSLAKPLSASTKSGVEIAPAPLPDIDGANDITHQLPSLSFQQHIVQAATSTAPTQPAVNLSQLNVVEDAGWIDTLARDIAMSAATDGRLIFRLLPERLGQLDIVVNHSKGNVDIIMQASTDAAASMIAADQPRLVEELRQSGLRVGHFEMTSGQHGGSSRQQYASPSGAPAAPPPIIMTPQKPRPSQKRSDRFA